MSDPRTVHRLGVVVKADDHDAAPTFYRDGLGMPVASAKVTADGIRPARGPRVVTVRSRRHGPCC